jgi:ectoine hydroxylase-related dioxygenase (phytanoyl-CoA dioxygenase family)
MVIVPELISRDDAGHAAQRIREIMGHQPNHGDVDQHLRGAFDYLEPDDHTLFSRLMTHPLCLSLARHLLGEGFQMTEVGFRWRKPGAKAGPVHVTVPLNSFASAGIPLPNVAFVVVFSWILEDLKRDTGSTWYLPFSHFAPRLPDEKALYKYMVPAEGPPGTLVLHHGALWHAFGPNTTANSSRVGLMSGYFASWMDPAAAGWRLMKRSVRDRMPRQVQELNRNAREA